MQLSSSSLLVNLILSLSIITGFTAIQATVSLADIISINNPGFEDPVLADGNTSGASTPGWSRLGAATYLNPSTTHFTSGNSPEGSNVATLNASGGGSLLRQDLSGTTLQYGTYTFQIDVGDRLDQSLHNLSFNFLINATTIVPLTSSDTPAVPDGDFRTWTFTYDVLSETVFGGFIGDPTRIRILAFGSDGFVTVDNVRGTFIAAVPEPTTMSLVALGILAAFRRKRFHVASGSF